MKNITHDRIYGTPDIRAKVDEGLGWLAIYADENSSIVADMGWLKDMDFEGARTRREVFTAIYDPRKAGTAVFDDPECPALETIDDGFGVNYDFENLRSIR